MIEEIISHIVTYSEWGEEEKVKKFFISSLKKIIDDCPTYNYENVDSNNPYGEEIIVNKEWKQHILNELDKLRGF